MSNALEQLRKITTVVADTGEISAVKAYRPVDCTTNPSLVLGAFRDPAMDDFLTHEIKVGCAAGLGAEKIAADLTVAIGARLCELIPGRVSTEVDANLSFDIQGSVSRARKIIASYQARDIGKERVLIKLASTWEGIRAAEILQREGIDCNLTLLFSMVQAVACAEAGAYLISPFVGRITDWYKKIDGRETYEPDEDPGVQSVKDIYDYYKSNNISTIVMGASFRNLDQIKALSGCDNLTIAPKFLHELENEQVELSRVLSADSVTGVPLVSVDESAFRWQLNADPMATEKLAEGIRNFHADHQALIVLVAEKVASLGGEA